jgi:uncharacterized membrane protein YukC
VVLLVLGSLSNVVGYQSVKSSVVNDSPLFQTRTQRATNQQQNVLISWYLGKGNKNLLRFEMKNSRTEQLKKALDIISKMDDKTFVQFTDLYIRRVTQDTVLRDTNPKEILKELRHLGTKKVILINSFLNEYNHNRTSDTFKTIDIWFPGCLIIFTLTWIFLIIYTVLLDLWLKYKRYTYECSIC